MINDLPDPEDEVKLSLFADDCSIWISGRNLNCDASILQNYFNKYQDWCNEWGFRISKSKTTAVLFSKKIDAEKEIELKIYNDNITFKNSVKFLGVIFDRKLTWNEHIKYYIVARFNKRINLLRALTGTDWGANKKTLIMLYRSLIRSVIDYGAIAYDSAAESSKRLLDQIQSKALRICCGAMVMTPVAALQVECGEMPLQLRRNELQLQYAVKLETSHDNPTRSILKDCWQNRRKFPKRKDPFMVKTRDLHQIIQTTWEIIAEDIQGIQPPWIREGATETTIEISNEDQIINNNDVIRVTNEDVNRDDNQRTTQSIDHQENECQREPHRHLENKWSRKSWHEPDNERCHESRWQSKNNINDFTNHDARCG